MSIKIKLLSIVFVIIAITVTALTFQFVTTIKQIADTNIKQYEEQTLAAKKESLKNYVDMAQGILQIYRDKVTLNTTKQELEEIKKDAIKAMDSMIYGDDGYVFVWSYDGVPLAFHPRPDVIGKNLLHLKGGGGKWVIKDHIANAKKGGGHFYTYKWKTTKDSPYQTKISYSFGVQDWRWFVGTGEYMSKEEQQIANKKESILDSTNKLIRDIILGAIVGIFTMGIIFYIILQRMIISPLNRFQDGLNNFFLFLQNKIDKVKPIKLDSMDEFGKMVTAINDNIKVSSNLHNEINELNKNLESKIEQRTIELEKQKEKFEAIYNDSKDAIAILDMKSNFLEVNPAYIEMTGFSKEELLQTSCLNLTVQKDVEPSKKAMQEVLEVGYIKNFEKSCKVKGNKTIITNMSMSLLHNPDRILISLRDVTKQKQLEKEIIEAKDKAEESTKAKSEFLANMSHEIRTPMNGIIGMTHLVSETKLDETQKKYIDTINQSSNALLNIINDILDFSKIEAGKLTIEKIDFNLEKVLNDVKNLVKFKADEKGLNFEIIYDNSINLNLHGDSLRISQVLINLINNAIKFTDHGYVKIYIEKEDNKFTFKIEDSGIGMSKEQQSKLFQSFSQADGSTTRKYGGTGLGLSISKQLVELMDGKIWCDSVENRGSTFSFSLVLPKSQNKIVDEDIIEYTIDDIKILQGSDILLTEDNHTNQEIVIGLLENSGINIDVANNGKEAVDMFTSNKDKYELILMDLQMPIMDGYEATKLIRKDNSDIPMVALTANAMKEDIEKTKLSGMQEHLNKPIEVEKLYETLLKYISKKVNSEE
ncbi:MAG: ATP-binding protein [Campylobacterota bacterium]|nr:ATP-binding protein [Campylobacterota bacterium]